MKFWQKYFFWGTNNKIIIIYLIWWIMVLWKIMSHFLGWRGNFALRASFNLPLQIDKIGGKRSKRDREKRSEKSAERCDVVPWGQSSRFGLTGPLLIRCQLGRFGQIRRQFRLKNATLPSKCAIKRHKSPSPKYWPIKDKLEFPNWLTV